jgi:hypothetical protein
MSITNEDRYHLQERANEVLGEKEGTTLMELLPPVGWADVAINRTSIQNHVAPIRDWLGHSTSEIGSVRAQMSVLRYLPGFESEFRADLEIRMFTPTRDPGCSPHF